MSGNVHEQARKLIALAESDGLSEAQQSSVRTHLQECDACNEYAGAVGRTVGALRSQPLAADFSLTEATRQRIRGRALELRQIRDRNWLVCLACAFVGLSAVVTSPLFWRACRWMGETVGVASWIWQVGFALLWIGPALLVGGLLMAHGTHLTNNQKG